MLLKRELLWSYVNGRQTRPVCIKEPNETLESFETREQQLLASNQYRLWEEKNDQAFATIALTCNRETKQLIEGLVDATELWTVLEKNFTQREHFEMWQAYVKLKDINLRQFENLTEYISTIRQCVQDLTVAGWAPPKWLVNGTLLENLTDPYDPYLQSLRQAEKNKHKEKGVTHLNIYDELDFDTLTVELKSEEARIKVQESRDSSVYVIRRKKSKNKNKDRNKDKDVSDNDEDTDRGRSRSPRPRPICKDCRTRRETDKTIRYYHNEKYCYFREDMKDRRPEWWLKDYGHLLKEVEEPKPQQSSQLVLLVKNKNSTSSNTDWHLDTCSNEHIVGDRSLLFDEKPTYKAFYWGGRYISTLRGSVRLNCDVNGVEQAVTITNVYYIPGWTKNLLSFGRLKDKGVIQRYDDDSGRYYLEKQGIRWAYMTYRTILPTLVLTKTPRRVAVSTTWRSSRSRGSSRGSIRGSSGRHAG